MLDQPLGQFLSRVVDLATQTLPGVDSLSITLVEDGRARSAAFSTPVAAVLDERQYESGFGPCLDAAVSGSTVVVDMDDEDPVYPAFTAVARRQGVRASTSVAMPAPHAVVGSLNLYSLGGPLSEETVRLAQTFAAYAAVALSNAGLYHSTARTAEQLTEAIASRAVIEQAKGIVMARLGVDDEAAFAHLTRSSQQTNTKLRQVAAEIVDRARRGELT